MYYYTIEDALKYKNKAERLYLRNQEITFFPKELQTLNKLQEIEIIEESPFLQELPSWLKELKSLKRLFIRKSLISKIDNLPSQLTFLGITESNLSEIPLEIFKLKELQYLFLNDNNIQKIPSEIKKLDSLVRFNIGNNQLVNLPNELAELTSLRFFDAQSNAIENLSTSNVIPTNLHAFDLTNNALTSLPLIAKNTSYLTLNHNKITDLTGIEDFEQLEALNINHNQLKELPDIFDKMSPLKNLNIEKNHLTNFPPSFYKHHFENLTTDVNNFDILFISCKNLTLNNSNFDYQIFEKRKSFSKAFFAKNYDAKFKEVFYNICLEKGGNPHHYPLDYFFKALTLSFTPLQQSALNFIRNHWEEKLKKNPIQKGSSLVLLGKSSFNKKELKSQLKKYEINLSTKINEKTTHVILEKGINNYENFDQSGLIFIPENALQDFFKKEEPLYLNEENTSENEIENIQNLLSSVDSDMVNLGLEMMTSLGVPEKVITELFLIFKDVESHSTSVRNKAKKLLFKYCSATLKANLETHNRLKLITPNFSKNYRLPYFFKQIIQNTELDSIKISKYLIERHNYYFHFCAIGILRNDDEKLEILDWYLKQKRQINIRANDLTKPINLFKLPLESLLLITSLEYSHCKIDTIPKELFQLVNLRYLTIAGNTIENLPDDFSKLKKLESLQINNNRFKKFPTILEKMPTLKIIYLVSNPFSEEKENTINNNIYDLSEYPYRIIRK